MPSSGLLEGLTVFAENTGLVVGQNSGGPLPVEGSGTRVKLWSRYSYGGAVFGGGHGHIGVRYTGSYKGCGPVFVQQ